MKREIHCAMTEARIRAGLSQSELARLMSTVQSAISGVETGRRSPSITTLEKWAEVTGHRLEVRLVPSRG